jgi:hypothetical protein
VLFADVVDVDKPGIFFRLGDATAIAYETIQVVVGDAQYEYDYAKCKYWDLRDCRCAAMVQSGSACAGEVESGAEFLSTSRAARQGSNKWDQQRRRQNLQSVVSCQRYHQSRGALLFRSVRARVNSPPTPEYVPVGGGRPVEGLSMRQLTMHDVNSLPKLSKSASRLALIRQGYVGRIRTNKG